MERELSDEEIDALFGRISQASRIESRVAVLETNQVNLGRSIDELKTWVRWGVGLACMVLIGLVGLFFQYQQLASAASLHR